MFYRATCVKVAVLCLAVRGAAQQVPINTGDINCDSSVNVADVTGLVDYLFRNGQKPCDFVSPGIAYVECNGLDCGPDSLPMGSWTTVISLPLFVPADGFVQLALYFNGSYCCGTQATPDVAIDTVSDGGALVSCLGTAWINLPVTLTHVMSIGQGAHTFYANIRPKVDGPHAFNQCRLVATYFPVNYGQ